ncbi:hypothetical protein DUI87_22994 [Hirundo rustica rustica]|uniref:Uncharacterized protein n=1 Tax=Hirundo rustica rustica TaxID=333673 RepID=A0A3M0JHA5_HIRRU|nr:hypothetical protein DUI87_22994 [Hirundo rustica rustica]
MVVPGVLLLHKAKRLTPSYEQSKGFKKLRKTRVTEPKLDQVPCRALWPRGERSSCWSMFADRTCGPVRNPLLEEFLKDCIMWKGPMLEQFVKNCSLQEELLQEKFVKESF